MDLLIKNMEMPKDEKGWMVFSVFKDGTVRCTGGFFTEAIEIPPHGRCIDADALEAKIKRLAIADYPFDALGCCGVVVTAPTVLEASE